MQVDRYEPGPTCVKLDRDMAIYSLIGVLSCPPSFFKKDYVQPLLQLPGAVSDNPTGHTGLRYFV